MFFRILLLLSILTSFKESEHIKKGGMERVWSCNLTNFIHFPFDSCLPLCESLFLQSHRLPLTVVSLCVFQVYLSPVSISEPCNDARKTWSCALLGVFSPKMPVARFLLDLISMEKFTFLASDHIVQVLLMKTEFICKVNLNEPRRDSRRGSVSGQLGGVMWNASSRSTSAFC